MTIVAAKGSGIGASPRQEFLPDPSWFAQPLPNLGQTPLLLSVSGMAVLLEGLSAPQTGSLERRYGIFARPGSGPRGAEMRVSVHRAGLPHFMQVQARPGEVEFYRVESRWHGATLTATSYEWAGCIDFQSGTARLALAENALADARAFDRSLENFLRIVYAHLAIRRGGFLLHAAGLVRDGEAFLFFGPSGSGKTTVTTMSPETLILSDDLTLVMKAGEGYNACSVPFRGLFAPEATSETSWPIRGFYRLVKAPEDRVEPLWGARAVGELMGSLPFVTDRPEFAESVIDAVAAAAGKVPVQRLHFRKDRTFWRVIRPEVSGIDDSEAIRGMSR